jgi:hypothetical protein
MKPELNGLVIGMRDGFLSFAKLELMQLPFHCSIWGGAPSPSVKGPGREADHSSLSNAEVNNTRAIPPLPIRIDCVMLD